MWALNNGHWLDHDGPRASDAVLCSAEEETFFFSFFLDLGIAAFVPRRAPSLALPAHKKSPWHVSLCVSKRREETAKRPKRCSAAQRASDLCAFVLSLHRITEGEERNYTSIFLDHARKKKAVETKRAK